MRKHSRPMPIEERRRRVIGHAMERFLEEAWNLDTTVWSRPVRTAIETGPGWYPLEAALEALFGEHEPKDPDASLFVNPPTWERLSTYVREIRAAAPSGWRDYYVEDVAELLFDAGLRRLKALGFAKVAEWLTGSRPSRERFKKPRKGALMLWLRPGRWASLSAAAEALNDYEGVNHHADGAWDADDLAIAILQAEDLWPDAHAAQHAIFEEIRQARSVTKDVKSKPQASSPAPA